MVGCWHGYLFGADLRMPLTVSCLSKIQIGFTFLLPAHVDSPGQKAVKWVCVRVVVVFIPAFSSLTLLLGRQEEHVACKH